MGHTIFDLFCGYNCEYYDCGLECPDTCPILKAGIKEQCREESEMLEDLGC